MTVQVSVIIPVYNAAPHIEACIRSLQQQTIVHQCEFIIVNDGSTDQSGEILERLANEDSRIRLITQTNQGVSAARNAGLRVARGRYIGFVDADDQVSPSWFGTLLDLGLKHDCDVVVAQFEQELDGIRKAITYPFPRHTRLTQSDIHLIVLPYYLEHDNMNSVCNKLYRRSVITAEQIFFPHGIALGEDQWFNLLFFSHAHSMVYTDFTGYYYREHQGSATRDIMRHDYFKRALEVFETPWPQVATKHVDPQQANFLRAIRLLRNVMSCIHITYTAKAPLNFAQRYAKVNRMVRHATIRKVLRQHRIQQDGTFCKYERLLLFLIRYKSALGLYAVIQYSTFRNRNRKFS